MPPRFALESLVLPGGGRQPNLQALLDDLTTRDPRWRPAHAARKRDKPPSPPPRERHAKFSLLDVAAGSENGSDSGSAHLPEDNTPHPLKSHRSSRRSLFRRRGNTDDGEEAEPARAGGERKSLMLARSSRRLRKHMAAVEAAQRMQLANESEFRRVKDAALMRAVDRSPKQVERLAKFMQQSERLKEFDFSVLRECARIVEPMMLTQGEAVYRLGEPARDFYIVIDGHLVQRTGAPSVDVTVNAEDPDQTSLVPMFTFGERELLSDSLREHSVQCSSAKAVLVKLSQKNFQEILAGNMATAFKDEISKVQQLAEFRPLDSNVLTGLIFCFQEEEYEPGEVIMLQGEKSLRNSRLLWITSGTASCHMDPCYNQDDPQAVASTSASELVHLCNVAPGGVVGDSLAIGVASMRHIVALTKLSGLSVSLGDLKRRFPRDILASLQNTASHRVTRDAARREQELKKASKFATIVAEGEKFAVRQGKAGKHAQTIPPPRRHSEDTVSQRRALTSKHDVVMGRDLWMLKVSEETEALNDGQIAKREGRGPDAICLRASTARKKRQAKAVEQTNTPECPSRGVSASLPALPSAAVSSTSGRNAPPSLRRKKSSRGRWVRDLNESSPALLDDTGLVLFDPVTMNVELERLRRRSSVKVPPAGPEQKEKAQPTLLPISQPNVAATFTRSLRSHVKANPETTQRLHHTVEIKPGETALQTLEELPSIAPDAWRFGVPRTTQRRQLDATANVTTGKSMPVSTTLPRLHSSDYPSAEAMPSRLGREASDPAARSNKSELQSQRRHSSGNLPGGEVTTSQSASPFSGKGSLSDTLDRDLLQEATWALDNHGTGHHTTWRQRDALQAKIANAAAAAERSKRLQERQAAAAAAQAGAKNKRAQRKSGPVPLLSAWMSLAEYRMRADTRQPNTRVARG